MRRLVSMAILSVVLSGAADAATYPATIVCPRFIQAQATPGTPGTGVPFAILAKVYVNDSVGNLYYKPRVLGYPGASARHLFWVDSTGTGGTPNSWQADAYAWATCPKLAIGTLSDTAWVWAAVKSNMSTLPEDESLQFRVRRGGTSYDAAKQPCYAMDMTNAGTGGWLTGHIRKAAGDSLRGNYVVLAYSRDTLVGSAISEDNRVNEGYNSADTGYFYMAVRAGQIDSLRVCARTEYRTTARPYTQIPRPWTVTAGGTTSVDSVNSLLIQNIVRTPQYPISTEHVVVSARITKAGGSISRDTIRYAANDTATWTRATHDSVRLSDSTYFYHIPAVDSGTAYFRLLAWDESNNLVTSPLQNYAIPLNHSIYQVQYTPGDSSPDVRKYVHTAGIVTGVVTQTGSMSYTKVYVGNSAGGPWSGVCLYRRNPLTDTLRIGDSLDVLAVITEFNQLTQLDSVKRVIHNGSGRPSDTTRASIALSKLEDHEGVLMRLDSIRMIDGIGGNFAVGTYRLTNYAGTDTTVLYVTNGSLFVGTPVPSGWCRLVCNGSQYNALRELDPRVPGDISLLPADVGVTTILSPAESCGIGDSIVPEVIVQNLGTLNPAGSFTVTLRIGSVYNVQQVVTGLALGASDTIQFDPWTAAAGRYSVKAFTALAGDPAPGNDTSTLLLTVGSGSMQSWTCKPRTMPEAPSARRPKDGAWMAYDDSTGLIYAAKGYKTTDFYSYSPLDDSWRTLTSVPMGIENKTVSKGSAACASDSGSVYATKGNNSQGFFRYDATLDSWYQKRDVPLGITNKKVKGGTDMVYVTKAGAKFVYLLKGYKNEFWRYDVAADSWQSLADAPLGTSGKNKYDKGSFLVYDGAQFIYAHKSKYHELFSYDVGKDSWTGTSLTAMPFTSKYTGKARKAKDGSCATWLDEAFYSFKGANTQELYRYRPAGDSWTEMDTIPSVGVLTKKIRVKGGADLVTVGGVIYAMKGNKSSEMWTFLPPVSAGPASLPFRDGVLAERSALGLPGMSVRPNPMRPGIVTLSLARPFMGAARVAVFDAAGRAVWQGSTRTEFLQMDLRSIKAGVYLVRVVADGVARTRKLVVEQ